MAEDGGAMVAAPIPFSAMLIMEKTGEQSLAATEFRYARVCACTPVRKESRGSSFPC